MSEIPSPPMGLDRKVLFRLFFFGVFLLLLYQALRLMTPFLTSLMSAVTLTLIFYPAHRQLLRFIKSPSLAASLSTVLVLVMIIAPAALLGWLLVKESSQVLPATQEWLRHAQSPEISWSDSLPGPVNRLWVKAQEYMVLWQVDLEDVLLSNVRQLGNRVTGFGAKAVKNTIFIIFDVIVLIVALFFFLRDGVKMIRWIADIVPMERENKELILKRMDNTLSAVVRGVFITAAAQGFLAGLGFLLAGVRFPVLLGSATAFFSLIPGAFIVWVPVAVHTLSQGRIAAGVFLVLWGIFLVSMIDNVLRPVIIGEKAKLPILLIFLGILGGLRVYGVVGILVGPLMIASVLSFAKIYREQYHRRMAKPDDDLQL